MTGLESNAMRDIRAVKLQADAARGRLEVRGKRLSRALGALERARGGYLKARRDWEEANSEYEMAVTVELRVVQREQPASNNGAGCPSSGD